MHIGQRPPEGAHVVRAQPVDAAVIGVPDEAAGAQVTLISGPSALNPPRGLAGFLPVESAADMAAAVEAVADSGLVFDDEELAANLRRLASAGVDGRYFAADVTDGAAVADAVDPDQDMVVVPLLKFRLFF